MEYILWVMVAFLFFSVLRSVRGPSIWDRLLGMNLISTKIIVIIIVFASSQGIAYLLDFAVIYTLTGFISTIFIASFIAERIKGDKNAEGDKN